MVYQQTYPKSRSSQDTLAESDSYAVDGAPLLFTIGIAHSFYGPASAKQLAHYARQVPVGSGGACNSDLQYGRRHLKPQRLPWTLIQP